VTRDANQPGRPPGQIAGWDSNIRIWAKTWSQLIGDCEARLRYFREALEYDASQEHATDYINRAHTAATIPEPLRTVDGDLLGRVPGPPLVLPGGGVGEARLAAAADWGTADVVSAPHVSSEVMANRITPKTRQVPQYRRGRRNRAVRRGRRSLDRAGQALRSHPAQTTAAAFKPGTVGVTAGFPRTATEGPLRRGSAAEAS
jgi:hypothetical protein